MTFLSHTLALLLRVLAMSQRRPSDTCLQQQQQQWKRVTDIRDRAGYNQRLSL
jgi:hypothetical protein